MDAFDERSHVVRRMVLTRHHRQTNRTCVDVFLSRCLAGLFQDIAKSQETLVLRDYHVDNLMWLPGRTGTERCGIGFQDALIGSRAYDVMSLIEDARRDIPDLIREEMISRYLSASPDVTGQNFQPPISAIMGAGRHTKVIRDFHANSVNETASHNTCIIFPGYGAYWNAT